MTHDGLGCASYLVGDGDAGVAAVEARFEIDESLELARRRVRIEHVLETHTHADHVSGHGRLAEATGATVHVHRAARAESPHEPSDDGWELTLGRLVVRAIHTPGHRPEHPARDLCRSLNAGLPTLPPETEIGFELGHNPILSEAGEAGLLARALAGLGPHPRVRRHRRPQSRPAGHRGRARRAAVGAPGRRRPGGHRPGPAGRSSAPQGSGAASGRAC